jgi:hypothetical protein
MPVIDPGFLGMMPQLVGGSSGNLITLGSLGRAGNFQVTYPRPPQGHCSFIVPLLFLLPCTKEASTPRFHWIPVWIHGFPWIFLPLMLLTYLEKQYESTHSVARYCSNLGNEMGNDFYGCIMF